MSRPPDAVRRLHAAHLPPPVLEAVLTTDLAERELNRPISPLSTEDIGDRETVLALWHQADKILSATALRPVVATEVLS